MLTDDVENVKRIEKLETTLRQIRGLSFKPIPYKKAFRLAVEMASKTLGVSVPIAVQNKEDL